MNVNPIFNEDVVFNRDGVLIKKHKNGFYVEDSKVPIEDGNNYVILDKDGVISSSDLYQFADLCVANGFNYALQNKHPRKGGRNGNPDNYDLDYLSFGYMYSGYPAWDIAFHKNGKNKYYLIQKRHKIFFLKSNFVTQETGGSGGLLFGKSNLESVIKILKNGLKNQV